MTMAGPSSAKAGMHGDGGSLDATNCFYDEMIDELTDGDGSNRTEYVCTANRRPPTELPMSDLLVSEWSRLDSGK